MLVTERHRTVIRVVLVSLLALVGGFPRLKFDLTSLIPVFDFNTIFSGDKKMQRFAPKQ
jgi:hypothetical protein